MRINITLSQILTINIRKPPLLYPFQASCSPLVRRNYLYSTATVPSATSTNSSSLLREKSIKAPRSRPWTAKEDAIIIEHGSRLNAGTGEIKTWGELQMLYFKNRSLPSVRNRWLLKLNPCVVHGPLTKYEQNMVHKGVYLFGLRWAIIAENLLPGRTSQTLRNWWYLTGDPNIFQGSWSPSEDDILIKGVQDFGFGNWTRIQKELLPHRSRQQIMKRYTLTLIPGLQKGTFSPEEQMILLRRCLLYGTKNWAKIAEGFPGRTPNNCRAAWLQVDPELRRNSDEGMEWTEQELEKFWARVSFFGNKWIKVAKGLPGRSAAECSQWFHKCRELIKGEEKLLGQEERSSLERCKEAKCIGDAVVKDIESQKNISVIVLGGCRAKIKRGRWSKEEDMILQKAILTQEQTKKPKPFNWEIVSSQILGRTVRSCRDRWEIIRNITPRTPWTISEDERLDALVKRHDGNAWNTIAYKMLDRTPKQCHYRWRKYLSPERPWSKAETQILQDVIRTLGFNWDLIASKLPRRSPDECRKRWEADIAHDNQNDYTISKQRTPWTEDEEMVFKEAIEMFSIKDKTKNNSMINWDNVAAFVGTRTKHQCVEHFKYAFRSKRSRVKWSWEEEVKFFEALHKFGSEEGRWKKISDSIGGNKDVERCKSKYYRLRVSWKFQLLPK